MRFTVDRIDHIVLTCTDIGETANWYQRVLGMDVEEFGDEHRIALRFGGQKINLHQAGKEFKPNASFAAPGTADICFVTAVRCEDVVGQLHACGVMLETGPVRRDGALGPVKSVYCRDPDGNLVEIATYLED